MGLFDVNFSKLVSNVLPVRWRSNNMNAWLNILVAPVVYVYGLFSANRTANLYRLAHNGQVVYLQAALNDVFDNTFRRITITDAVYADPLPLYLAAEEKPLALYLASENKPIPLYTVAEVTNSINGFIVNVPAAVSPFDTVYMKALIDKYRLVGMSNYMIKIT